MKNIYILQMDTGTFLNKIVKKITKYDYGHIALSLDLSLNKMYSFGRKRYYNPIIAGFTIEDIDGSFFSTYNKTKCRIYKLTITKLQYKKLVKLLKEYENNKSKYKYDVIGLILKLFSINIKRKNYYVCSQFVAEVLSESNICNFNKNSVKVKPIDFEYISDIEEIYTGLLLNMKKTVSN